MPRVSVLLPVRQPRLDWLKQAIASIRAQTVSDWELLVVVDDEAPLDDFLERFDDPRIRHLHLPRMPGLPAALNHGVESARAPLVARLDADDVAEPQRLDKQLAMFERDAALDVAGSQLTIIDEHGKGIGHRNYPIDHDAIASALRRYNCIAHPSVMFRRDRVLAAGGYLDVRTEDYDLWCRLVTGGARLANHEEALMRYRAVSGFTRGSVHRTLRATIETKRRNFDRAIGWRGELRILIERLLLFLPQPLVEFLFRATEWHTLR